MKAVNQGLAGSSAAQAGSVGATQQVRRTGAPRPGESTASGEDRVELSSTAGQIARVEQAMGVERSAKVAHLAAAVAGGQYQPDAAATSRGLVTAALSSTAGAGRDGDAS